MAKKLAAAVEMGKRRMQQLTAEQRRDFASAGGTIGGKVRAQRLSPERRKEIARKAVAARWAKRASSGSGSEQKSLF
jgi:hypothetical protein